MGRLVRNRNAPSSSLPHRPRNVRKCCGCIPLRLGLCLLAGLMIVWAISDIVRNLITRNDWATSLMQDWIWLKWVSLGIDSLVVIASSTGLVGVVTNTVPLLSIWSHLHSLLLLLMVARTLTTPILMATHRTRLIALCEQRNPLSTTECPRVVTYALIALVAVGIAQFNLMWWVGRLVREYRARLLQSADAYRVLDEETEMAASAEHDSTHTHHHTSPSPHPTPLGLGIVTATPDWANPTRAASSFESTRAPSPHTTTLSALPPLDPHTTNIARDRPSSFDSVRLSMDAPAGDLGGRARGGGEGTETKAA